MEIIRVCACAVPKITMRQTVRSFSCSWISSKGAYLAGLLDHTFCCFARLTHPLHKYACLPLDERCVPLAIRQQKILNGRQKVGRISGRPDMVSIRESGRGCVFLQNGDCRKIRTAGWQWRASCCRLCLRPELRTPGEYFSRFGQVPEIACNQHLVAVLFEDFALSFSKLTAHANQNDGV